jgi:DNA uptake protein ComE-like DNA-binding protein
MPGPTLNRWQLWTLGQQKTLLALCLLLLVWLGIEQAMQPALVPDPPTDSAPRANEIQDCLDPNTADAAALSAIPSLGESKARDIVAFRETFIRQHPGQHPFNSADDLMQIKGIGPGVSSDISPYLYFPQRSGAPLPADGRR